MSETKRKCPKCGSSNTGAVFNGFARSDGVTHVGGCGCEDCGQLWTELVYTDHEVQIILGTPMKAEDL